MDWAGGLVLSCGAGCTYFIHKDSRGGILGWK